MKVCSLLEPIPGPGHDATLYILQSLQSMGLKSLHDLSELQ